MKKLQQNKNPREKFTKVVPTKSSYINEVDEPLLLEDARSESCSHEKTTAKQKNMTKLTKVVPTKSSDINEPLSQEEEEDANSENVKKKIFKKSRKREVSTSTNS